MAEEGIGQNMPGKIDSRPSAPTQTSSPAAQGILTDSTAPTFQKDIENGGEVVKELHWVHHATFWTQVGLGIIGIAALFIYGCQLSVMRGTLAEMKRSGEQSTEQVWSAIGNLNWMARTADQSSKDTLAQMRVQSQTMQRSADSIVSANRAWMVPDFPPQNKHVIEQANLDWHNAGKTPAISVFSWKEYFTGDFPRQMRTCSAMVNVVNKQTSDVRQYQAFVPEGGRYTVGLDHAPPWFAQQPISIHGCIWYTDISSNTEKSSEFFYVAFQGKDALPRAEGVLVFFAAPFVYK